MRKGKFSLIISIILLSVGFIFVTLGVLSTLGVLPSFLQGITQTLSFVLSLSGKPTDLWQMGVLLLLDSLIILTCRQRRPFSSFMAFYIWPMYFTLMGGVRVLKKEVSLPSYYPTFATTANPGLFFVLFVLEGLLALVILSAVKDLDNRWRKKRDINRRMLEKEGVIKTKETLSEEKLLKRQKKLKEIEDKKIEEENAKYEKERVKAEKRAEKRRLKEEKKEKLAYEKKREVEAARREKELQKEERRELKKKDKKIEKEQLMLQKKEAKESKKRKKEILEEERIRKEEEAEAKRREEEELEEAPEYNGAIGNPNTPLVFPDFDPMPSLKNIVHHEIEEKESVPEIEEEKSSPKIENKGFMDSIRDEMEREEDHHTFSGGMLEAALESAAQYNPEPVDRSTLKPIIGIDYPMEEKHENNASSSSSIAPSNLSPDHPRYKYFEALQKKPEERVEEKREEKTTVIEQKDKSSFSPSYLSPDHPRYKYFEELAKERKGNVVVNNKEEEKDNIAPSNLPPDHPRHKLFEALKEPNMGVSYIPQRPFTPEEDNSNEQKTYEDVTVKEEVVVPPMPTPKSDKDKMMEMLERINAAVKDTNLKSAKVEEEGSNKDSFNVEEEKIEERKEFVAPEAPRVREVKENDDGHKTISVKSEEEENADFNLVVGVGDLSTNIAGYIAIEQRQKAIYTSPGPDLLKDYPGISQEIDETTYEQGTIIVRTLADQKIMVELSNIIKGPTVTMYELKLAQGTIINKITARENELNYALGGKKIRILAPVPGKQAVGIEVPNVKTSVVGFKDMIYALRSNDNYLKMKIPMILGKTITGEPIVIDVSKMPHMIIAGTTGSGKSVCINSLINTIIYQKGPKDVRLILVDPKVVELTVYDGIPHLLTPVITDAKKAIKALDWLVTEMERRYSMLAKYGVRNIGGLNDKIASGEVTGVEKVPYILLIMDEFADIMAMVGKEMDVAIGRIAAKARAAGIHMILATQRPSVDVITGTLKSNLPGRIAFAVSNGTNSRVILDEMGAENLLGKGDMLLLNPSEMGTKRIQGAFVSDGEVDSITTFTRKSNPRAEFLDESIFEEDEVSEDVDVDADDYEDGDGDLYEAAKKIVFERKSASASFLQRRLKIGYNRAARLVEMMEEDGIVGPANGSKPREVLKYFD